MSNFDIQYNFIAIDRFTKVARKVQKEASKIAAIMDKSTKGLSTQSAALVKTTSHVEKAAKKMSSLGTVTTEVAKKTTFGMKSIVKGMKQGGRSVAEITEKVAKLGDSLAFKGYIQFMNIGLPIMLAGKMGLDYADQIEGATLQMDTLFGKQKNYAAMWKQINVQAADLSKHSRFTRQEIVATSAHIGMMTSNLKLSKDLTPMALQFAALQKVDPSVAADALLASIRAGGLLKGTGMVLPKGEGSAMAQKRFQMLMKYSQGLKGVLAKDADTASASLHKMMESLKKLAGTLLIQAIPALISLGSNLEGVLHTIEKFLNAHQKLTGDFVKGALMAMTWVTVVTLLGATLSAVAMPFELLVAVITGLRTAYLAAAAASVILNAANAKSAAEAVVASGAEGGFAKTVGTTGVLAAVKSIPFVGAAAILGTGVYMKRHEIKAHLSNYEKRMAYVKTHGFEGFTGEKAAWAYRGQVAKEEMSTGTMGGFWGSRDASGKAALTQTQHKIDMKINVSQDGKVTSAHAHSPSPHVALGVNMVHAHG